MGKGGRSHLKKQMKNTKRNTSYEDVHTNENMDNEIDNTVAKIKRQMKYLRSKFGEPEDEMHLNDDEEEDDQKHILGGKKNQYGADNRYFELLSSDDDALKEEEMVAMQIQKDITKSLTMADYGLDTSEDETERDLTLKEASVEEKDKLKWPNVTDTTYKEYTMNDLHGYAQIYKQVKEQRAAKLAAKAQIYSRNSSVPSLPETVEGRRPISHQMEKNKGLTPKRKKLTKNPRRKYKLKHQKAVKNRQGQVRNIRMATGPYGGEPSGINAAISRSIRFKG